MVEKKDPVLVPRDYQDPWDLRTSGLLENPLRRLNLNLNSLPETLLETLFQETEA